MNHLNNAWKDEESLSLEDFNASKNNRREHQRHLFSRESTKHFFQ